MAFKLVVAVAMLVAVCAAQQQYLDADYADYEPRQQSRPAPRAIPSRPLAPAAPRTTPVPILKQINRHNDDGSYTYGFEGADGTFKIETKFANGDVKGKYGFVDDTGKVRTVEYGADRYGFQPAGEGITVAPPTLVDESLTEEPEFDEFRPRPAPQRVQQRVKAAPRPQPQPRPQQFQPRPQQQPQYQPQYEEEQYEQQGPAPGANFQQQTTFAAAPHYEVQEAPEPARRPAPVPKRPLSIPGAAPVPQRPIAIPGAIPAPVRSSGPAPSRPAQFAGAFQAPDPVRPRAQPQQQHSPRAGPQQHHQQPQQPQQFFQPQPAPQAFRQPPPQQARAYQAPRAAHGSVLDQLAKDYALPSGGSAATHDITFSSGF